MAQQEQWVEIKRKGVEGTARVDPRALEHWKARGWEPVDAKAAAAAQKESS